MIGGRCYFLVCNGREIGGGCGCGGGGRSSRGTVAGSVAYTLRTPEPASTSCFKRGRLGGALGIFIIGDAVLFVLQRLG